MSVLLVLSACSPNADSAQTPTTAHLTQEVQVANLNAHHFELVQDGSLASKATGSLEVPLRNPDGTIRVVISGNRTFGLAGTCGMTFISPHYAITAAHCVSSTNVLDPQWSFRGTNYDMTAVNLADVLASARAVGFFPNYQSATQFNMPGSQAETFGCQVAARCSYGSLNCGFFADIAMMYCPLRDAQAAWLPVAPSDPKQGPVEMYWFHELWDMPWAAPGSGASAQERDEYAHYTLLTPGNEEANFHYLWSSVLLPFKSVPWPDGTPRTRLGSTSTDLFGCHGTSGSGVLQRNASGNLELLGPVSTGAGWAASRLCTDPTYTKGTNNLSYTDNTYTNQLQSDYWSVLMVDRYGQVPPAQISTDAQRYRLGQFIQLTWANLPGNANDWVAYAPAGSPDTTVTRWAYTNGSHASSLSLEGPLATGSYVARAFASDSYTKLAESPVFTVEVGISTDASSYAKGQALKISWSQMPGNAKDWVGYAPVGSPDTTVTNWAYTNGQVAGSVVLWAPMESGTYVARAFSNDSYTKVGESAPFSVP